MRESLASEDQIIASVLAGRTSEFRQLIKLHHQTVYRFARNLIGDQHDAEDIAQEVFLAAFDHLRKYKSERASLQTWLLTITRNRCVNHLKRKRPIVDTETIADTRPGRDDTDSARNEFWRRLDLALAELPVEQKTAFVLAEIEGLSYADIAEIEKTTLGTAKSRVHRAKQRLRLIMQPMVDEH